MILNIQPRLFSMTTRYIISDEAGREVYRVCSGAFAGPGMVEFRDSQNNVLLRTTRHIRWFHMSLIFHDAQGNKLATMERRFGFGGLRAAIDSAWGQMELRMLSWGKGFQLSQGGNAVATALRKSWLSGDLKVQLPDDDRALCLLAVLVAMDQMIRSESAASAAVAGSS